MSLIYCMHTYKTETYVEEPHVSVFLSVFKLNKSIHSLKRNLKGVLFYFKCVCSTGAFQHICYIGLLCDL